VSDNSHNVSVFNVFDCRIIDTEAQMIRLYLIIFLNE